MQGFLVINKPKGLTSHDVVDRIRVLTGEQRVGHGGTLDPLATGVLIIGVGREATRHLGGFSTGTEKVYRAVIHLGATSDTDDAEGMITESEVVTPLKKTDVIAALKSFKGTIQQVPPAFSAKKIEGRKAYQLARAGQKVQLDPQTVSITNLHIEKYEWPLLTLEVTCSSGTYIRALARDIGEALLVGGHLEELVRMKVAKVNLVNSVNLEGLNKETVGQKLIPVDKLNTLR